MTMEKKRNIHLAYKTFFEALQLDDIDAVVSAAWNFFGCPVLFTDENYKLISQYPRKKIGVTVWDTLFDKKVLPEELVEEYQKSYLNGLTRFYRPFYADSGLVADCPRIFGEVFFRDVIYGHIAVFLSDAPLEPDDLEATQIFIDALKMLVVPRKNRQSASLASALVDLLNNETNPQIRAHAVYSLSVALSGNFSVMVTPIGSSASRRAFAAMAVSHIPLIYRAAVSVVFDDHVVTLLGLMSGGPYTEKEKLFFEQVAQHYARADLPSGISPSFHDLSELPDRYQQALTTAKLAKKSLEFYDDIMPEPMFGLVCQQVNAELFMHPVLKSLAAYDEENHTDYFNTLMVYSLSLHNKEQSAAQLCIHRNTLLYRLNKILEIFQTPFEEPQTALAILNSFQLWKAWTGEASYT